ncbi:hypothetical protein SASPL_129885 [Salvia splendens]|uniref:Uncharacterized protein n=1 Tax=Salvia splendens TaxID=180675 RepID=A0A8X8XDJ0_SALSN|nr:hypothetical protein SASPL_129885 [Salvia splendens]
MSLEIRVSLRRSGPGSGQASCGFGLLILGWLGSRVWVDPFKPGAHGARRSESALGQDVPSSEPPSFTGASYALQVDQFGLFSRQASRVSSRTGRASAAGSRTSSWPACATLLVLLSWPANHATPRPDPIIEPTIGFSSRQNKLVEVAHGDMYQRLEDELRKDIEFHIELERYCVWSAANQVVCALTSLEARTLLNTEGHFPGKDVVFSIVERLKDMFGLLDGLRDARTYAPSAGGSQGTQGPALSIAAQASARATALVDLGPLAGLLKVLARQWQTIPWMSQLHLSGKVAITIQATYTNEVVDDSSAQSGQNVASNTPAPPAPAPKKMKRKRKSSDDDYALLNLLGNLHAETNARLDKLVARIGYEIDLGQARKEIFRHLGNILELTESQCYDLCDIIGKENSRLEIFTGLPDASKSGYVRRIIEKEGLT